MPALRGDHERAEMGAHPHGDAALPLPRVPAILHPDPKEQGHGAAVHAQAVQLYLEGMSQRAIGRLLGVVHQSVANWVTVHAATLPADPVDHPAPDEEGEGTVEVDELETFIGGKSNAISVTVAVARDTRLIVGQRVMWRVELDAMQPFADALPAVGRYCIDGAADHLRGFLAHCAARGQASSTRRCSVAAIRAFFAFLVQERVLRDSPARLLLPPERETRPPRVLTGDQYRRLRGVAMHSPRDSALIELVLQTGLRLSEIARLTVNDVIVPAIDPRISLPTGHVRVAGRGAKSRIVTLNLRACEALTAYLAERDDVDSPALFLTKFGAEIGPRGIENIVAKYCKQAGISGASVRTLRHTMAVEMLKRGATPAVIGQALGHASPDTVTVYTDLVRERMDEELQRHAL